MKFYKYHGAGNDFVLVENLRGEIEEKEKPKLAKKLCNRKFGVGGDGLLLVEKSKKSDVKMRVFNLDGTEPNMCGNGIRCFAKHVRDRKIVRKKNIKIETLAGERKVELSSRDGITYVKVEMGKPIFEREGIPARGKGTLLKEHIMMDGKLLEISAVNTGVPHAVVFVDDIESVDVMKSGVFIRYHNLFPEGANVNFLQKIDENVFMVRTYERGVEDETLACGTGITAGGAVAVALGLASQKKQIEVRAKGGVIYVKVEESGVVMNGPAEFVFEGKL